MKIKIKNLNIYTNGKFRLKALAGGDVKVPEPSGAITNLDGVWNACLAHYEDPDEKFKTIALRANADTAAVTPATHIDVTVVTPDGTLKETYNFENEAELASKKFYVRSIVEQGRGLLTVAHGQAVDCPVHVDIYPKNQNEFTDIVIDTLVNRTVAHTPEDTYVSTLLPSEGLEESKWYFKVYDDEIVEKIGQIHQLAAGGNRFFILGQKGVCYFDMTTRKFGGFRATSSTYKPTTINASPDGTKVVVMLESRSIHYSEDSGETWMSVSTPTAMDNQQYWTHVQYKDGVWYMDNHWNTWTTTNMRTWTRAQASDIIPKVGTGTPEIHDIIWSETEQKWIMMAMQGNSTYSAIVLTSPDFVTWTEESRTTGVRPDGPRRWTLPRARLAGDVIAAYGVYNIVLYNIKTKKWLKLENVGNKYHKLINVWYENGKYHVLALVDNFETWHSVTSNFTTWDSQTKAELRDLTIQYTKVGPLHIVPNNRVTPTGFINVSTDPLEKNGIWPSGFEGEPVFDGVYTAGMAQTNDTIMIALREAETTEYIKRNKFVIGRPYLLNS